MVTEAEFIQRVSEQLEELLHGRVVALPPDTRTINDLRWFLGSLLRRCGNALGPTYPIRLRSDLWLLPDLFYAVDSSRYQERCYDGAPDLVLEIVSADSVDRDWRDKFLEYQAAQVPEYWVVDPLYQRLVLYRLEGDTYGEVDPVDGWLISESLPGFRVQAHWLWARPLPDVTDLI